jgi:hypothetical protein
VGKVEYTEPEGEDGAMDDEGEKERAEGEEGIVDYFESEEGEGRETEFFEEEEPIWVFLEERFLFDYVELFKVFWSRESLLMSPSG